MGTGVQTGGYAWHHLHSQAPLRVLYVAIGLYGIFGEELALEEWQGRRGA